MSRTTIDYGIDLGTATSSIAVLNGTEAGGHPERGGQRLHAVGGVDRQARAGLDRQEGEEPLLPGSGERGHRVQAPDGQAAVRKHFDEAGRDLSPEELSAEVLKKLRDDVRTNKGEDPQAVVITVPAAFELDQVQATQRAAELAGFKQDGVPPGADRGGSRLRLPGPRPFGLLDGLTTSAAAPSTRR